MSNERKTHSTFDATTVFSNVGAVARRRMNESASTGQSNHQPGKYGPCAVANHHNNNNPPAPRNAFLAKPAPNLDDLPLGQLDDPLAVF
jgi:hypothetical protein